MIVLYLLVSFVQGLPKVTVYQSEQQACVDYATLPGSHVYQVSASKRDDPKIAEGDCKPVQQFIGK